MPCTLFLAGDRAFLQHKNGEDDMPTDSYEDFKSKVFALTKIDLNMYKERQMKRRIDALITKYGLTTYNDFVGRLKTDKVVYDDFLSYMTINVSEFFRNPEQWKLLEKEIFPELLKKTKQIKVWSAACSTGDEPYTIVMILSKFLPLNQINVIATDIDKQILEKAKIGVYNAKSIKEVPEEFKKKYFTQLNDTTYKISDEIKSRVKFENHNLLKDPYPKDCDLIVCRNVVIYFTEEAKTLIYKQFNQSLKQDGVLFVGSTEQIIQPAALGFESFRAFFYKKLN